MKPVLQTRYVGQAPDLRHPLAPPEHVYEVGAPIRRKRALTFWERAFVWLLLLTLAFIVLDFVLFVTTGAQIPYSRAIAIAWFPVMAVIGWLANRYSPPSVYR
jgi:hypothetical protein